MKTVDIHELDSIIGGDSISGTVINAFTNVIKLLLDAGRSVGSAIRRGGRGKFMSFRVKQIFFTLFLSIVLGIGMIFLYHLGIFVGNCCNISFFSKKVRKKC